MSLNVSTLAKRMEGILDWGFDLCILTEVRSAATSMPSMQRRAKARGFEAVFSTPPGASPTFSVAPGGVCCIARHPLTIRSFVPPVLKRWEELGRVLCVKVLASVPFTLMGVYGFPAGHPERRNNDSLIAHVFHAASEMNTPVLIMGDFNVAFAETYDPG